MRKHCPRKPLDPMAWITRRLPLTQDQARDLGIAYRLSLETMMSGKGTEQTFSTLACSLNIALILCEQGVGEMFISTIKHAQNCLTDCRARALKHNTWSFTSSEARHVLRAFAIHDEQIAIATANEVIFALGEVHRRIENNEVLL